MNKITKRRFLKTAAVVTVFGAGGRYFLNKMTEPELGGTLGSRVGTAKRILAVSDVGAHFPGQDAR
ncbi:MAG: hypothetical protein JW932_10520 [Deltaproteobacteria bacterium]|nr:hypothetical protein [Deltaproteobacteria bacterium]